MNNRFFKLVSVPSFPTGLVIGVRLGTPGSVKDESDVPSLFLGTYGRRPVVVKSSPASRGAQEARMYSELQNTFFLRDPEEARYFLTVYKSFVFDKRSYLVLQACPRGDLLQCLRDSDSDKLGYLRHVLGGIAFLHRWGILHRDIKPSNCLIDSSGGVRIGDLETACFVGEIRPGIFGTLSYFAPEMLTLLRTGSSHSLPVTLPYSVATDMFAFGMTAYCIMRSCRAPELPERGEFWGGRSQVIRKGEISPFLDKSERFFSDAVRTCLSTTIVKRPTAQEVSLMFFPTEFV